MDRLLLTLRLELQQPPTSREMEEGREDSQPGEGLSGAISPGDEASGPLHHQDLLDSLGFLSFRSSQREEQRVQLHHQECGDAAAT